MNIASITARPARDPARYRVWYCALFLALFAGGAHAVTCTSAAAVNNWSTVATWSCGHVPANGDDVVIAVGGTTTLNVNSNTLASLTVNGTLTINAAAGLTMTVTGNIAVTGTFSVGATAVTHTLNAGGNITNTGTINFAPSATRVCNVIFNKNGNQTVSGAGAYTFNKITLNMGVTNANILDMQSAMTAPAGFLTITNGTYKHDNASNITPWSVDPAIPASGGFWLASAATVSTGAFNVTVNGGLFRIDSGAINVGTGSLNMLNLGNFATTSIVVNGGTLTAAGGINSLPSPPPTHGSTGAGSYTQTAGTVLVSTCGCTTGTNESFMLGSNTTFTMSGGTIIVRDGNASSYDDANIQSSTVNVTGGTFQFGDASSTSGNGFLLVNSTGASVTVWNFVTSNTNGPSISLGTTLNILNNLTIGTGSTLTAVNMLNAAVSNSILMGGTWTNNSIFTQGTGTVTFTGTSATAAIGGTAATTFNNLTINKASNNVAINSASAALSPTVNGTLTLTSGKIITTIGTNDIGIGTAGTISGASATSYVVGSVQKNYAAAGTFTFPVGDATNYTPVVIAGTAGFTAGSLTINTTGSEHPSIGSSGIDATKSVNRYWTLTAVGMPASTYNATFNYINGSPVDYDAGATPANFIVEQWSGAAWFPTTLNAGCTATPGTNLCEQINGETGFGDFAIGEAKSGMTAVPGRFNAFETATAAGQIIGVVIQTKVAGTAFGLDIVSINAAKTGYGGAVANVTVQLLDSSNNTGVLDVNGCRSTWTAVQTITTTLNIPAGGRVTLSGITVNQAYRDARLQISSAGPLIGCSTDRFAIRPQSLTITAWDQNWQSAGTTRGPLANIGASGGYVHKASTSGTPLPFTLRATPVPASATNYDGIPTTVTTTTFPNCTGLVVSGLCTNPGILNYIAGSWTAAGLGVRENATATYSEAGAFNLQLEDAVYAGVDSGDTPAAQLTIPSTATAQIGRFVPDHFSVTSNAPVLYTFNSSCALASKSFSYIGQPLTYSTRPSLAVTALNSGGGTTTNYRGTLWKLPPPAAAPARDCTSNPDICVFTTDTASGTSRGLIITQYTYTVSSGALPNWDNAQVTAAQATVTAGNGTGTITWASSDTFAFLRNLAAPRILFTANITLTPSVIDRSEIGGTGVVAANSDIFTPSPPAVAVTFDAGSEFRYGRLWLQNANGSELLQLPIPMETQYFNGTGFVTNLVDNCTTITNLNVGLGNFRAPLAAATATITPVAGAFVAGKKTITLSAPGAGNNGAVTVAVNLGSTTTIDSTNTCLTTWTGNAPAAANLPYLRGQWCGANFDRYPTVRATFGIYRNTDRFIYQQENY